jgi:hypothetical protein
MPDPLGRILTEIRDDATVAAITTKIRGGEPAKNDALGPGSYQPFVVLVRLGTQREKRLPVQEVRIAAKCYAATAQLAAVLAGAVSDAVHARGPRISPSGVGIWTSFDDGGEGASNDPSTLQPYETVVISVNAADRPIV